MRYKRSHPNFIENHLSNSKQSVKISSTYCDSRFLKPGVPQGTILGPLFFIIYINEMFSLLEDGKLVSYDTTIISTAENWTLAEKLMNNYLSTIKNWLDCNHLILNIDKTVFISYGLYVCSVPTNLNITIDNFNLKRVENTKFLGIIMDCHMRWDSQIQSIIKKTKYLLYIFYKLSLTM